MSLLLVCLSVCLSLSSLLVCLLRRLTLELRRLVTEVPADGETGQLAFTSDSSSGGGPRWPPRQLSLGSRLSRDSSNSTSSNMPRRSSNGSEQQLARAEEEASFASAGAAALAAADADTSGDTSGFIQWLARNDVLDALQQVLQDGAAVCLNSSRKVEAMLIFKVTFLQLPSIHACMHEHACMHLLGFEIAASSGSCCP
ncbi:hypothetical protein Efla_002696 [Eimeria flavescens]